MTKKDFQLIAATIAGMNVSDRTRAGLCDETARYYIAESFADSLARTNPLFKRDLFIQAATGQVSVTTRRSRTADELIASASDVPGYNSPSARLLRGVTERAQRNGAPVIEGRTLASDLAEDRFVDDSEPSNFISRHRSGRRAGEV